MSNAPSSSRAAGLATSSQNRAVGSTARQPMPGVAGRRGGCMSTAEPQRTDGPNFPGAFAAVSPDKPAVIMAGSGETLTYRELDDEANRLARVFYDAGLRPGDHVAFCLENSPRFLCVAWGAG